MNKYALSLAGGALLATTALATGTVSAATVRTVIQQYPGTITVGAAPLVPASVTTVPLATEVLTSTSSAVTLGPRGYLIDSGARLQIQSTVVFSVSGAEFDTTVTPVVTLYDQSSGGTYESITVTINAAAIASGAGVTMFTDKVLISNIDNTTSSTYGVIEVSGVVFRQAQALATAGNSITLSGSIQNGAQTTTLESIDSKAVITSRNAVDVRVVNGTALTISSSTNPIFTGIVSGAANVASATLASVIASVSSALSTDLTTNLGLASTISTVEIKLTHAVLNDAAVTDVTLSTATGVITKTPAQFSAGTVTFSPAIGDLSAARAIRVTFNGTTAITAVNAGGTVAVTLTARNVAAGFNTILTAPVSAGGTAAALNRGGLNTTFNLVQPSTATFASFIRVANIGGAAGNVAITLRNSATGASLGTYTSVSIASGGSIQIPMGTMESQSVPAITPVAGVTYDITVTGAIAGFAQHIGFSPQTGGLADLSSFRNGGATAP